MAEYKILRDGKLWEDRIDISEDWANQVRDEYEGKEPLHEWTVEEMTKEEIEAYGI